MKRVPLLLLGAVLGLLGNSGSEAEAQAPPGSAALRVEIGVEPRQVRVGEPFFAAIGVAAPPGITVDYLPLESDDFLQALSDPEMRTSASGAPVAVYPMVAWIAGAELTGLASVRITDREGNERVQSVRLQLPEVVSVLPAGEQVVEPRPARGVVVPSYIDGLPWWWWLALLLGTLVAALIGWHLLRRVPVEEVQIPRSDPAEWALARLAELRTDTSHAGHAELFLRVSWILRTLLWRVDRELGPELTTTEFRERLGGKPFDAPAQEAIGAILQDADRAKFARYEPTREEAEELLEAARRWVEGYVVATREIPPAEVERAA